MMMMMVMRGVIVRPVSMAVTVARTASVTVPSPVSATAFTGRQSLDNAIAGEHTPIDGEVTADHESPHRCVFLSQSIGFIGKIRLVFPAIDEDQTSVP